MTAVKSGDEARTTTAGKSGDEEGDRNQRATGVETEDTLTYPLRVSGDDKIAAVDRRSCVYSLIHQHAACDP